MLKKTARLEGKMTKSIALLASVGSRVKFLAVIVENIKTVGGRLPFDRHRHEKQTREGSESVPRQTNEDKQGKIQTPANMEDRLRNNTGLMLADGKWLEQENRREHRVTRVADWVLDGPAAAMQQVGAVNEVGHLRQKPEMITVVLIVVAIHGSLDEIRNVRELQDHLVGAITNQDKKTVALRRHEGEGDPRPELHRHVPTEEPEDNSVRRISVLEL
jgi:hypothetical protein